MLLVAGSAVMNQGDPTLRKSLVGAIREYLTGIVMDSCLVVSRSYTNILTANVNVTFRIAKTSKENVSTNQVKMSQEDGRWEYLRQQS